MLRSMCRGGPGLVSQARTLACCAGAGEVAGLPLSPARPGTVTPYDHHLLLALPGVEGAKELGAGWPSLVERNPAILLVFSALARHRDIIDGKVKVTAMEGVGLLPPSPGTCHFLAFPKGLQYTGLPLAKLGQAAVHAVADDVRSLPSLDRAVRLCQSAPEARLYIFVCCHAARDARCGTRGPALLKALRQATRAARLHEAVAVVATSHIGGHEFAGNVVVYGSAHPCDGDWFGGLEAVDAPAFFNALHTMEVGCDGGAEDAVLRRWWRGRRGLSAQAQAQLYEDGGAVLQVDDGDLLSWQGEEEEEEEGDFWKGDTPRVGGR